MTLIPDKFESVDQEKAWWREQLQGHVISGVLTNDKNNIIGLDVDGFPVYVVNGNGFFGTLMVTAGDGGEAVRLEQATVDQWSEPKGKSPPKHNKSNLPPTKPQTLQCLSILKRYWEVALLRKEEVPGPVPEHAAQALALLEQLYQLGETNEK